MKNNIKENIIFVTNRKPEAYTRKHSNENNILSLFEEYSFVVDLNSS